MRQHRALCGIRACAVPEALPQLYDAWFGPSHELAVGVQGAVTRAMNAGVLKMEVQWPVVPNLEEIAAGTLLNYEFGKLVARTIGMAEKEEYGLVRRYLAEWCNLYWVLKIAEAEVFADRDVWAVSGDCVNKERARGLANVKLASMKIPPNTKPEDVVVVIDPRYNEAWIKGIKMQSSNDSPVIMLNSQFNETYGLTGPRKGPLKDVQVVYYLKRVTRGYVFFSWPGPWQAYLEKPDSSVELLATYDEQPKLSTIANLVRQESNARYGAMHNDRYVTGMGGRL